MAISIAFDGPNTPIPGIGNVALGTITWDASCDGTGEALDCSAQFSTISAVIPLGCSAIGLAGYVPAFFYAAGAAADTGVNALLMIQDGAAGALEPADAVDIAALGTTRVAVVGQMAIS